MVSSKPSVAFVMLAAGLFTFAANAQSPAKRQPSLADRVEGATTSEPAAAPEHRESLFALQIKSSDGVRYVNLDAGLIGAVRVPLIDDPRYSAVLVSLKLDGDTVQVTLAGEKGELETVPIAHYAVPLPQGAPAPLATDTAAVRVPELAALREGAWELRIVAAIASTMPGCCSCAVAAEHGRLHERPSLNSCPSAGRCLGCGGCGICCG